MMFTDDPAINFHNKLFSFSDEHHLHIIISMHNTHYHCLMISLHTPYHKARYLITLGLVHHGHTGGHIDGGLLRVGELDAGLL